MTKIVKYSHHGVEVSVREDLKGKHKEYCLCYSCDQFEPDKGKDNCPIARIVLRVDVLFNLVTPVWECASYTPEGGK